MKAKLFSLMTLSILAIVLTMGLMSAAFELSDSTLSKSVMAETASVTFDISVDNDGTGLDYTLDWSGSTSQGTLVFPTLTDSLNGTSTSTTFRIDSIPSNFVGTITGSITALSTLSPKVVSFTINVEAPTELLECSTTGNLGELEIRKIKFTNNGLGEKRDEWLPLDTIEVEIEIKNDGNSDVDDISLEWGLYDTKNNIWVIDLDEEDEFNLKDGDREPFLVSFKIDDDLEVNLDELEDGDNYRLYVVVTGVIDDSDSLYDEFETCAFSSEPAKMFIEKDFLILNNFEIEGIALEDNMYPDKLSCGSNLALTLDLWNIGKDNQDDIKLRIYNFDFGIDELLEIGEIDSFEDETLNFQFTIPEGMEEGWNTLELTIQEDGKIFQNDYVDDADAEFEVLLDLENCAFAQAFVTASIDEGGKAGRDLVVRATITNTGAEATTYLVNAFGYSEWASLVEVAPSTIILQAGQVVDVLITLDVDRDVSGERLFNIEVVSEGQLVVSQPLSVSIEKALLGDLFGDNNLATILIIGIALILLIIIIVLAVRVARR